MERKRCGWVNLKNPQYIAYHDTEWSVPVHDDVKHFEYIILESAQAGLSWETILKKREGYRRAFLNFNPKKVALFTEDTITALLQNEAIVRHTLKIKSAVQNAKSFIAIQKEFGSFDAYVWAWVNGSPIQSDYKTLHIPSSSEISVALSKDLKKRGFTFFGATTCYAYMQAVGMVNDHTTDCFLHAKDPKR